MVKQRVLSPAKINLMLRITSKRTDGFHDLQTYFQLLNWGDQMLFEQTNVQGTHQVAVLGFGDLPVEENLIYQAALMLKPWAQKHADWKITVDKVIPLGSGLGGGSSNAAATLKFLNEHWQCDLSTFDLLALAVKLGADVPVFVLGQAAMASGIGNQLTPTKFHTPHILLLFPDCHINTAELFSAPELTRDQSILGERSWHDQSFWLNDFFPVVLRKFPEINRIYQRLKDRIELRLSGTGSTLFAVFEDEHQAMQACQLASQACRAILVKPLMQSGV